MVVRDVQSLQNSCFNFGMLEMILRDVQP
jgi:hypothetical protein